MARIYNSSEAVSSPDEGRCSTKPEQREWLQTQSHLPQTKYVASIGTATAQLKPLEVQAGAPVGNVNPSAQPHPALIALARLLAEQAAAELIKISNTALDVDQP